MWQLREITEDSNTQNRTTIGEISDGYHTFDELYAHRIALFIALMRLNPDISWRANNNSDGTHWDGWFVAGMHLPTGDISYHLPEEDWNKLDGCGIATSNKAPEWDGHNSYGVIERLTKWAATIK